MKDTYGRTINYMRISITDRCNLRCRYCMPNDIQLMKKEEILSMEEIEFIGRAAVATGINRFKVTGGEPLVRKNCAGIVERLKGIPGTEQVTLTTNGVLLSEQLDALVDAGLDAVNISLDTLNADRYEEITGKRSLDKVIEGIETTIQTNLKVKINVVLQKQCNEGEWMQMTELAQRYPVDVRFIEMMPIGLGKRFVTVDNVELLRRMQETYRMVSADKGYRGNGPAIYYQIADFQGRIGFISAIHGKFCDKCNRVRLTAQGQLKPCLCYDKSVNIREIVREEGELKEKQRKVEEAIQKAILEKPKQHCFENLKDMTENRKMAQIGG